MSDENEREYDEGEEQNEENNEENEFNHQNVEDSVLTEETIIFNEGAEDDYLSQNDHKNKTNQNNIENKQKNITHNQAKPKNINAPIKEHKTNNQHQKINKENKIKSNPPVKPSKVKYQASYPESDEEKNNNENNNATDELFKKAIEKNSNKAFPSIELDNEGNTLSTKVTEVLYDKFVGQNIQKSKHLDIYSKIKDEEIRQGREATRTKDDAKKINNMIVRQEDYEKLKSDKKKDRQREIKNKINEECIFVPNGKKNVPIRTPNDFYIDQKKFLEKKEEIINKMTQSKLEDENKNSNVALISKNSEKLANSKNPRESQTEFCKRLAEEKLKNIKDVLEAPREEKRLTKKELKDLTEKLHKEKEIFKINREKKEQEQISQIKKMEKNDFVLEKSKKVLFDKFISNYEKILMQLFNKTDNFQITYDEFKNMMNCLGFIKSNSNSESEENLIKDAFNYLKPNEEKVDTNAVLMFGLTILGIYKGNDEKIQEHLSKITLVKPEEEKSEDNQIEKAQNLNPELNLNKNENDTNNNTMKKKQKKRSTELIKSYLPNLDLEKYGCTEKECKMVKNKFMSFVSGMSEIWAKDLLKKKQERQDKLDEIKKLEETKKIENKQKKEEEIIDSYRRKVLLLEEENDDNAQDKEKDKDKEKEKDKNNNTNVAKSYKVEDMYEILQKKKERELQNLKEKQEEDIRKQCTFQPNSSTKPVNKKEVAKNIEKLYLEGKNSYIKKRQQEKDPDMNSENRKNCTFKPVIKDFKGNYFENNPLKEDKLFNTELKRMEKVREEKGYSNKEIKKQMEFGIEPKSNKEEIYKRVIPNRTEKIVGTVKNEYEDYNGFDDKGNQNLLKIEVNLENNKTDLLVIYPKEDYVKVVDDFCNKHELTEEKRVRLIRVIKDKMRNNDF